MNDEEDLKKVLTDYFTGYTNLKKLKKRFPSYSSAANETWLDENIVLKYGKGKWDLVEIGVFKEAEENVCDGNDYCLEIFWGDQFFYSVSFNFIKGITTDNVAKIVNIFMDCSKDEDNRRELEKAFQNAMSLDI